jgi:NhaP-type Na+/H+ or K+/H+ antiporter
MTNASSPVLSILFLFFALLVGAGIMFLCSRLENFFPYTVVIFIFGILISILADSVTQSGINDVLVESTEQWSGINSDVLLCAFLPALLFGEAMHLNFYQVKQAFSPAALLAFPGAAFGAYMLGKINDIS